jgi:hypothetical protein
MGSLPPDPRLIDISHFGNFGYVDWLDVPLRLPILPVSTIFPGDYRSREELSRDVAAKGNLRP